MGYKNAIENVIVSLKNEKLWCLFFEEVMPEVIFLFFEDF